MLYDSVSPESYDCEYEPGSVEYNRMCYYRVTPATRSFYFDSGSPFVWLEENDSFCTVFKGLYSNRLDEKQHQHILKLAQTSTFNPNTLWRAEWREFSTVVNYFMNVFAQGSNENVEILREMLDTLLKHPDIDISFGRLTGGRSRVRDNTPIWYYISSVLGEPHEITLKLLRRRFLIRSYPSFRTRVGWLREASTTSTQETQHLLFYIAENAEQLFTGWEPSSHFTFPDEFRETVLLLLLLNQQVWHLPKVILTSVLIPMLPFDLYSFCGVNGAFYSKKFWKNYGEMVAREGRVVQCAIFSEKDSKVEHYYHTSGFVVQPEEISDIHKLFSNAVPSEFSVAGVVYRYECTKTVTFQGYEKPPIAVGISNSGNILVVKGRKDFYVVGRQLYHIPWGIPIVNIVTKIDQEILPV